MPEDKNKDDARLKEDSSAAARQRFERDLQEGEQWASLSGKTIDLTQLLRWSVSNATRGEDAPAAASESARKHEPIVGRCQLIERDMRALTRLPQLPLTASTTGPKMA